jgi:Tol biopolymer transport system component
MAAIDLERPNRLIADLAKELNLQFLDLLPAFRAANGNVFFDYDEHLNAFGHGVMAAAIGDHLERFQGPSQARLVSRDLTSDRYPVLSPDGTMLSYQSLRDGNMELFVSDPALEQPRRITFNDVDEAHPMLSKDGSTLIFTEGSPESMRTRVVAMRTDGSKRTALTAEANEFGAIPTFSRSNTRIAYAGWTYDEQTGRYTLPKIMVLDLLSGQRSTITPDDAESWRPVFSPDERSLIYISKRDGQFDLYATHLSTGRETRLTATPFDEWDPTFTPDGERIVYAARAEGNWDLFALNLTTRQVARLTSSRGDEWDPSVSPDGVSLLFAGRFGLLEALFRMPLH